MTNSGTVFLMFSQDGTTQVGIWSFLGCQSVATLTIEHRNLGTVTLATKQEKACLGIPTPLCSIDMTNRAWVHVHNSKPASSESLLLKQEKVCKNNVTNSHNVSTPYKPSHAMSLHWEKRPS